MVSCLKKIRMHSQGEHVCHDCGAHEGELHQRGCDMELCPFCGWQLISCDCCFELLEVDEVTAEEEAAWVDMLNEKGRVPFIVWPNVCARCGILWPKTFLVPNEEWANYIQITKREQVLCLPCYQEIKALIDTYAKKKLSVDI